MSEMGRLERVLYWAFVVFVIVAVFGLAWLLGAGVAYEVPYAIEPLVGP